MHLKKRYLILFILIAAALGLVLYRNLSYEYTMQGQTLSVLDWFSGMRGYEVTQEPEGLAFHVTEEDPQFFLTGTGQIGGLELCFYTEKMESAELPVQVFYAKAGEEFSEKRSSGIVMEAGKASCILPIPLAEYETLRVDIDGNFYLTDIKICTEEALSRAYISEKTLHVCLWYFPAIIIGFSLIFWAHSVNLEKSGLSGKRYVKSLLTGKEGEKREVYLDYLRAFATVLVIVVHSCAPITELQTGDWRKLFLSFLVTFAISCNLLYVMLSGALLLSSKKEMGIGAFYLRRASRIMIPLVLYYILYLQINGKINLLPPEHIGTGILTILQGPSETAPHLSVIYIIAGLYIAAPFLKVMVQNLKEKELKVLAVILFFFIAVRTYLPLLGVGFGFATFLTGWEGIFMLGYIITRLESTEQDDGKRKRRFYLCMAAAIVSYIVMSLIVYYHYDWKDYVYNNVPTMIVFSVGIYMLFLRYREWFADKANFAVRLLSKYSYSIILIHWSILPFVSGKFHVTALRFGCIGGVAAMVFLVLLISVLAAIIFDNTVVIIFTTLFDKLGKS